MPKGCQIIGHLPYGHMQPGEAIIRWQRWQKNESRYFRLNFNVNLIMLSLIWANFTEKYENIFSWDGKKDGMARRKNAPDAN
jgi:hypothetical protein